MRSNAPGRCWTPQSLLPEMKIDGTSIVRPANSCNSLSNAPEVRERYQLRPPWNPLRWYSPA